MMPNTVSGIYDKSSYLTWHNSNIEGIDLEVKLNELREELKSSSKDKLRVLAQLLTQIKERTEPECKLQTKGLITGEFILPTKYFSEPTSATNYDLLFKSTNSIIEKFWRKNAKRQDNFVCLSNIKEEITDLIRTFVVCPTLFHAEMFSKRFEVWKDFIPQDNIEEHFSDIDKIEVDEEAKAASGYFAYHALVHFTDGLAIEVQFYSQLSSAWRTMSHKLYENSRIGSSAFLTPNSPETRLISLGHLLHLAECELKRLAQELQK
jgi:ppGpp synthetase/RelA/SpoT-type nucleotidyltranferase